MAMLRVLLIVGVVGALTVWVVAVGLPLKGEAPASTIAAPRGREPARADSSAASRFDVHLSGLRTRLQTMPALSAGRRKPFRFASDAEQPAKVPAHARASIATEGSAHGVAAPPDRPMMQLLGVAEEGTGSEPSRTAVIATARQLYLVREGEQIALRFQVSRISADAVELHDLADDSTFRLALR